MSDAQVVKSFHSSQRMTVPVVVVTTLIATAGGVLTGYFSHRDPVTPAGVLTKDQFDESMRERDERLSRRLDTIETDTSYLKVTLRLVQDRLPPQK